MSSFLHSLTICFLPFSHLENIDFLPSFLLPEL